MTKSLTAVAVKTARPTEGLRREIPDGGTGLYLVVQPTGAKSWAFRFRFKDRPRKLTLGPVLTLLAGETEPDDDPIIGMPLTLKAARQLAGMLARQISRGVDPTLRTPSPAVVRVKEMVDLYLEKHVRPNTRPRSAAETERLLKVEVLPHMGERPVSSVLRSEVVSLLDRLAAGKPVLANRVLAALRAMFNWAVRRDMLVVSPCAGLQPPGKETARDRVLSDEEVSLIWGGCDAVGPPYGTLVKLLLVTGQRLNEVAQMRWSEIDFDKAVWRLPADRSKNGQSHEVPLSPLAVGLLEGMPKLAGEPDYVFTTGIKRDGQTAEGPRLRPVSGFSKWKGQLDRAVLLSAGCAAAEAGRLDEAAKELPSWRLHDLRRTAATGMASLGVAQPVVERVLNHVGSSAGIVGVYQRHSYTLEKVTALKVWADHLQTLTGG